MSRPKLQPYPGLRSFERYESRIFFGRQQQVDDLLLRLKQHHFLAVLGASGSGKSSLVKAGLLPGLEKGYMGEVGSRWRIAEMRPGDQPFMRLAESLIQNKVFAESWQDGSEASLCAELRRGARSLHEILQYAPLPEGTRLLLLVDQFEEIFRFREQAENQAAAFVALLLEASRHPDIYIVITMRSDFLGKAAEFQGLPEAINAGLYLTPRLTRDQLHEAISLPAQLFGGTVDAALVNYLLNEAGNDPDQLPLLQHALMRLWQHGADKTLTLEDYRGLQGLRGALDDHAEQAWQELDKQEQALAETLFRALTERSKDGQDIRRPLKVQTLLAMTGADLPTLTRVVDVFRQAGRNFLMPSPQVELTPESVLDISHESLIRQWQRLQEWVKAEGEKAAMYLRLLEAAQRHASKEGELWHGTDLALARQWRDEQNPEATWALRYVDDASGYEMAMQFLLTSEKAEQDLKQAEQARQQAELKQAKRRMLWACAGLLLALGLAAWGLYERNHAVTAEQNAVRSLFDSTVTHASLLTKVDDFAATRNKLDSTRKLDADILAPRRHARDLLAGYTTIMGGTAEATFQDGNKPLPQLNGSVAISPDGHWLAASGERGTVALFERASGKLVQKLEGHKSEGRAEETSVRDVVFHPKQPWLFSGGGDGRIIRWTLPQDGQPAKALQQWSKDAKSEDFGKVYALALTPDGKVLASGHADGRIRLWDVQDAPADSSLAANKSAVPKLLRVLEGHSEMIANGWGLVFSPDGRQLASASYDNTVRLWDWEIKNSKPQVLQGTLGDFNGVAFSEKGDKLAASGDAHILIWYTETKQKPKELKGHQNMVFDLQFFPTILLNGLKKDLLLASASSDNTIRLWDVETGIIRRILQGHTSTLGGLALWQAQGQADVMLYSASNDGTVKSWKADLPQQWLVELPGEPTPNAISPDGRLIVVGFNDGSLRIYALPIGSATVELLHELPMANKGRIVRFVFNAEGSRLASGGMDGVAKVWSIHYGSASPLCKKGAKGDLKATEANPPQSPFCKGGSEKFGLTLEKTFTDHKDVIHTVTFSPNGSQLATASYDGHIRLFALEGEAKPQLFKAHEGKVASVSFDPSGKQLLSAGYDDFKLKLWDLTAQPPTAKTIATANYAVLWASLSPDGTAIASVGREYTVSVYPANGTGAPLRLNGHESTVYKAIFSPDSRQLATVSADMTIRLWDLGTKSELFRLRLPIEWNGSPLWDFDFRCTPTGCWIAVPLTSGKLALYNLGKIKGYTDNTEK